MREELIMSNVNDFVIENGILKRYNGTDEHVKIPEDVIGIGYSAFCNCNAITSVIIGDGVTYIDDEAFKNCENLTSVDIPNQVTSIGKFAFKDCFKYITGANLKLFLEILTVRICPAKS